VRVTIASIISCIIVYISSSNDVINIRHGTLWAWIGIRQQGWLMSTICPTILLTMLFLGPIFVTLIDGSLANIISFDVTNIKFWRNYFVAPLSEEIVFRGLMLPLLVPAFGKSFSIVLAPLFFGIAHIHHALEQYEDGVTIQNIIIATSFQAFYTTIFGIFSSYIFLRTGHLISSFISHAFCNIMGFPDFETAFNHKYRFFVAIFYIFGLLLFIFNLYSLTNPTIFNNVLYT